jgi:ribosomal protein S12 methylthiotransferase
VKIAEGCDRGCTFCAIPLMRGKFRSRSSDTVAAEIEGLVAQGVTEFSLVSQDSVMWGRDTGEGDLVELLERLELIDGVRRIRLMYLHPQGVNERLIDHVLQSDRLVHYFDLSLQHVSPPVLKMMGRWGGRDRFQKMVDRIRAGDPLAGIRSTFILGFPGERESDAAEVDSFVAETDLDWIGTFTYSLEEGTRSFDLADRVPESTARARAEGVQGTADTVMERRARSLTGNTLETLVERFDIEQQVWTGRSQREAPEIDGEIRFTAESKLSVGDYVPVSITGNDGADLLGSAS